MQKSSISYILKLSIPIFFANLAIPLVAIIDTAVSIIATNGIAKFAKKIGIDNFKM